MLMKMSAVCRLALGVAVRQWGNPWPAFRPVVIGRKARLCRLNPGVVSDPGRSR